MMSLQTAWQANEELNLIRSRIRPELFKQLDAYISESQRLALDDVHRTFNQLSKSLSDLMKKPNSRTIRTFLVEAAPETMQSLAKHLSSHQLMLRHYANFIRDVSFPYPDVLRRYVLHPDSFLIFDESIDESLYRHILDYQGMYRVHMANLKKAIDQHAMDRREKKEGKRIVAAGSTLLLGPLAGLAAKLLIDTSSEVLSEFFKPFESYMEELYQAFLRYADQRQSTMRVYLYAVYGGLIIKLDHDMDKLGFYIDDLTIDNRSGHRAIKEISLSLLPGEEERFTKWADKSQEAVLELYRSGKISEAHTLLDQLKAVVFSTPALSSVQLQGNATCRQAIIRLSYYLEAHRLKSASSEISNGIQFANTAARMSNADFEVIPKDTFFHFGSYNTKKYGGLKISSGYDNILLALHRIVHAEGALEHNRALLTLFNHTAAYIRYNDDEIIIEKKEDTIMDYRLIYPYKADLLSIYASIVYMKERLWSAEYEQDQSVKFVAEQFGPLPYHVIYDHCDELFRDIALHNNAFMKFLKGKKLVGILQRNKFKSDGTKITYN